MKNGRSFKRFETKLRAIGLLDELELKARAHYVTLEQLYKGPRVPSIIAARKAVYSWLMSEGKGLNEVAGLFDRIPAGVAKLVAKSVKKTRGKAKKL